MEQVLVNLLDNAIKFYRPGGTVTIGGMAKGSGMIHPDMATTLGFVTTDAAIEPGLLQQLLLPVPPGA